MRHCVIIITACAALVGGCESEPSAPRYSGSESRISAFGGGGSVGDGDIVRIDDGLGGYLVGPGGRPLYLFAADRAGRSESACVDACADQWPAFDVRDPDLDDALAEADFSRFERADGSWQTTYKGRPLYYYAADEDGGEARGDGLGGKWFVARDYAVFLSIEPGLTPAGSSSATPYFTNRAGRTAYVLLSDRASLTVPASTCDSACTASWPIWIAPTPVTSLIVPSVLTIADFGWFQRADGGRQLSYRGWPVYFHTPDQLPGETSGHNVGSWRAFDPVLFAQGNARPDSDDTSSGGSSGGSSSGGSSSGGSSGGSSSGGSYGGY